MPGDLVGTERRGILGQARNHRRPIDDWVPPLEGVPTPSGNTKLVVGEPWREFAVLPSNTELSFGLGVAVSADYQTLYVLYGESSGYRAGLVVSTDGGQTWTNRGWIIDLASFTEMPGAASGLILPSGRVIFYIAGYYYRSFIGAIYSDNQGATWTYTPTSCPKTSGLGEDIDAVLTPAGRVVLAFSIDTSGPRYNYTDDPGGIAGFQAANFFFPMANPITAYGSIGFTLVRGQQLVAVVGSPYLTPRPLPKLYTSATAPIEFTESDLPSADGDFTHYAMIERSALYWLYEDGANVRVHISDDYVAWRQQVEPVLGLGTILHPDEGNGFRTAPIGPDQFWLFKVASGTSLQYAKINIIRGGGVQVSHDSLINVLPDQHHNQQHNHQGGAGDASPINISLATTGNLDIVSRTTGVLGEARIDPLIARDSEVVTATSGTLSGTNVAAGKTYTTTPAANASYPDTGGVEMTNGALGTVAGWSGAPWAGWADGLGPTFVIDLGVASPIYSARVGALSRVGGTTGTYIYYPNQVDVQGSNDNVNFVAIGSGDFTALPDTTGERSWLGVTCNRASYRYVKVIVTAGGAAGWTWLDEVEVYDGPDNTAVRASAVIDEVVKARTGLTTDYSNLDQRLDSMETLGSAGGSVLDVRALVSILRSNFKIDNAHNFSKNALKGMVIDVFSNADGIDAGLSGGYIYNSTAKSVKAADGGLNLVASKTYTETPAASASFPDTGGVEMTNGVLGNPDNYNDAAWAGWDSVSPTFVIDLGGNFSLGRMRLGSLSRAGSGTFIYFPDQIDFYGSLDGTNYTLLASLDLRGEVESSTGARRWFELVLTQPFTARSVKCYVTGPAGGGWLFLDELEVYPPGAGINHGLLSSGGTAAASSEASERLTSRGAVYTMTPAPSSSYPDTGGVEATDGLIGDDKVKNANYHGWSGGANQTLTLRVDLGASQALSRGRLGSLSHTAWGVYYPDQLAWEGSNDNVNWTPLATQSLLGEQETVGNSADGTGGTRKWFEVALAGTYRYVRCLVTTGGEWTFLDEIEVYGAATASLAFDGSSSTAWQAAVVGSSWIKRDFGVTRTIGEIRLLALVTQTQSMTYSVEVSQDDAAYTTVLPATSVTISPGGEISATFSPTNARYVRVTASFGTEATGFREVGLLGAGGASALVVSTADTADVTPNRGYVTADFVLNGGSVTFFMSRDNGSTWTEMPLDALIDISAQPMGDKVRVKANLVGGTELQAWAWGWAQ